MKNRDRILKLLNDKFYVSGRYIQIRLLWVANPDTISRELRRLREHRLIEVDKSSGYVRYKLIAN